MRIKEIIEQHRRDFTALYECEHCGHIERGHGYDDANYHRRVIPQWRCSSCGQQAPEDYVPRQPKYPEGQQI